MSCYVKFEFNDKFVFTKKISEKSEVFLNLWCKYLHFFLHLHIHFFNEIDFFENLFLELILFNPSLNV